MNETETRQYQRSMFDYDAARRIPGRSLTRSKAPGRLFDVGSGPLYASGGEGCELIDVDGNRFVDMICALGAISLGYGRPFDRRAATEIGRGWCYSLPSNLEGLAAEKLIEHVAPWATSARFVKTGSEATHAAYRIARRATGRPYVFVGDWAYHGWHEWCSFSPNEHGIDWSSESRTAHRYPHGQRFDPAHGVVTIDHPTGTHVVSNEAVAAVFVEPHRWEPVSQDWLRSVREFCDKIGALLVFDEMIYGGRWALGGATEYFEVRPDLACFGKAFGNGAPIAAVVGLDALAAHGEMVSGTYSGDAAALGAFLDVLRAYVRDEPSVVETLWARGRQLRRGLWEFADLFNRSAAPAIVAVEGEPVHQRLRFRDEHGDRPDYGRAFAAAMAARGVLWHPDVVNVCAAHTEAHIERVIDAALGSIRDLLARS